MKHEKTMLTDLYQLTMNASYSDNNKDDTATFDMFIRKLPEGWNYFLANGIEDVIDYVTNVKFDEKELEYLESQNIFKKEFLDELKDFKFEGDVYSVKEGTVVFPDEPLLRITGKRTQVQFLESAILNMVNFQTMISSKASRVVNASQDSAVVDFGLRRAQGEDAAMKAARAAYIAGCVGTSNVKAGMEYGIPISGTHAHSFVMSFETELDAFRAYTKTFPDNGTLLIDTYDTIQGAKNASIVAKELVEKGHKLGAVRLDSGDLVELSKEVREVLDENGLEYVKIFASNDLNEHKITEHKAKGAKIDAYGVGTEMITAKPVAAISGVYKIVEDEQGPKIKLSTGKKSYPGKKQIYRVSENGKFAYDIMALESEECSGTPLLEQVVSSGERVKPRRELEEIREYANSQVSSLSEEMKSMNQTFYDVKLSSGLTEMTKTLTQKYQSKEAARESKYEMVKMYTMQNKKRRD